MKIRSLIVTLLCLVIGVTAFASTQNEGEEIVEEKGKKYLIHNVVAGETLYALSRYYDVSINQLKSANKELAERGLIVGQRLRVPFKKRKGESSKRVETDATTGATNIDADTAVVVKPAEQSNVADSVAVVPPTTALVTTDTTTVVTPSAEVVVADSTAVAAQKRYAKASFRRLEKGQVANIALMLPLGTKEQPSQNYVDFYRGFLIGLDTVRMSGKSANIRLYNTGHDHNRISEIVASGVLDSLHMVVGPVYEDELIPIAAALEGKNVPIVSPLAKLEHTLSNAVFQMSPLQDTKYSKLGDLRTDSTRVVIITTDNPDVKFESELREYFKDSPKVIYHKFTYLHPKVEAQMILQKKSVPGDFSKYLRDGVPTVFFITASSEMEVDKILSSFGKMAKSLLKYGQSTPQYVVVGNNRWNQFDNIDRTLFFSAGITTLSTYFAHRSMPIIKRFDKRFIREFGALPTPYAYRGYDAAVIFVNALFDSIENGLEGETLRPLATPYTFCIDEVSGLHINSEWSKVRYNEDFTITIE